MQLNYISSALKTDIEMVVRRSEMRGHNGKEVECPQKRWMVEVIESRKNLFGLNIFYS